MANTYGFDPVAWSIDGGRHRGELLRVLAYASTAGSEGIVSPADCKVHQLTTPGTQVAIDSGAVLVRNRSANVKNQTYVANGRVESRLDVTATGSSGSRSDLVVIRIEDPQYSPWTQPSAEDAPTYQYVKPVIIQNVPANTTSARDLNLGYSAYAVARIDLPANTSTVTNAMIKDLRNLAQPRSSREVFIASPPELDQLMTTVGEIWPEYRPLVYVPEWATQAYLIATLASVGQNGGAVQVLMTAVLGGTGGLTGHRANNIGIDLDAPVSGGSRHTLVVGGAFTDIRNVAGKNVYLQTEGVRVEVGNNPGWLMTVPGTQVLFDVQFYERPV